MRRMKVTGIDGLAAMLRILMLAVLLICGRAAFAQDALPGTPPELRDFRLDPEKAKPAEPKPEVKPQVIEVPEVRTVEPAPRRNTPPTQAVVKPKPITTNPEPQVDANQALPTAEPISEQAQKSASILEPKVETAPIVVPEISASAPTNWWLIGAAGLALSAVTLLGLSGWTRRRKRQTTECFEEDAPSVIQEALAKPVLDDAHVILQEPETAIVSVPVNIPENAPKPAKAASPADKRPILDISFVPKKATLSVANLTIMGELRIINQGKVAAKSMRLRSIIISASEAQDDVIAAFHADKNQYFSDELGEANAGERIGMEIELSMPLTELHSFEVGNRRLFAPIVLAHIDFSWSKTGHDAVQLAALIGREATPPSAKMAPLRLDLGPRSFAPLEQRPIFV